MAADGQVLRQDINDAEAELEMVMEQLQAEAVTPGAAVPTLS